MSVLTQVLLAAMLAFAIVMTWLYVERGRAHSTEIPWSDLWSGQLGAREILVLGAATERYSIGGFAGLIKRNVSVVSKGGVGGIAIQSSSSSAQESGIHGLGNKVAYLWFFECRPRRILLTGDDIETWCTPSVGGFFIVSVPVDTNKPLNSFFCYVEPVPIGVWPQNSGQSSFSGTNKGQTSSDDVLSGRYLF